MGNPMTRRPVRPLGRTGAMTPLLRFLAGTHAEALAIVWPAPHAGFLALPSARRHAAAILLARDLELNEIARLVEFGRDGDVAKHLMHGQAAGGLMKSLSRLGEILWEASDYNLFLSLFSDENTAQVLRHTDEIRPEQLHLIRRLPVLLRVPKILRHIPDSKGAVDDLAEAFRLAVRMRGKDQAASVARRWERAASSERLFDMAAEDLQPVRFGNMLAPPDLPPAFFRVGDRKTLEQVALEFRNCLRDFTSDIAAGHMAVYVLRDGVERAVLALRRDTAGWRLAEAKGKDNSDLREETLRFIVDAVELAGGRTGESSWVLARRLHEHVCGRCGPAHVPVRETWEERLMLGSLWD
ncbi:hypothetical protein [Hyphomonas sp. GM-8P]|uniref:hypothetical protein n=1 Tax=Hyphomonas sp. GM-8P TaxID=1280945 RepID=UPI000DBF6ABB|nr:hypothetical protein [Hyphomonas sp. GM-8P]RAN39425.1 hypothetical protein HY26_15875 [Hyphomonas sp. GM-8P]